MKKVLFSIIAMLAVVSVSAQKKTLVINAFEGERAEDIRGSILSAIMERGRVNTVDPTDDAAAEAQFSLDGKVNDISVTYKTSDDGSVSYYATIQITLTIKDAVTGTIKANKQFAFTNEGNILKPNTMWKIQLSNATSEEAIKSTIVDVIKKELKDFIDDTFPLEGEVVQIEEVKGDEAKTCYISLGAAHGVIEKTKLEVFVIKEVAGKEVKKKVGEMQVKAVESDELSFCEIKKGGKEILAAINNGSRVVVITK